MIDVQVSGPVRVLSLSSGRVNAMDVELLEELTGLIGELQQSWGGPLVITGAGRVFSAGLDLDRLIEGGAAYTDRLVPALTAVFDAVFSYPGPTVAAINGAAIAGGCVLACACDRRLITPEAQIGATEVHVGVSFPVGALEVVRYACGDRAEEVLLFGRLYRGADAVATGLAHTVVAEGLLEAAVAEAAALGEIAAAAYADTKAQLRGPTVRRIRDSRDIDVEVARMWGAEATREGIAAAIERMRRR